MTAPKVKVYVVTSGSYSDYGIETICSTRELAEMYCEAVGGDIEEWHLDEYRTPLERGLRPYAVCMDRQGNSDGGAEKIDYNIPKTIKGVVQLGAWPNARADFRWRGWAKTKTHAIKIANDLRRQALAENKFPPRPA